MREYFPRLLGNDSTKQRLGKAVESGALSHAFLISGQSGTGKSTLATELAAAVNCERRSDAGSPLPCGRCNTCKRIYENKFTDITVAKRHKDKATLGVDIVKALREDMFLSATESERKIYIFDEAECMTDEAQNALLKVLEEPPLGVIIMLLTTECDKILTTIKSRTQLISMTRFDRDALAEHLCKKSRDAAMLKAREPEKFDEIAVSADGRLGEALRLLDPKSSEELRAEREETLRFISALSPKASYAELHSAVTALTTAKRHELSDSLERIVGALRDLITARYGEVTPVFYTTMEDATRQSAEIGAIRLQAAYDAVLEAQDYCARNGNVGNLLTNLSLRIGALK